MDAGKGVGSESRTRPSCGAASGPDRATEDIVTLTARMGGSGFQLTVKKQKKETALNKSARVHARKDEQTNEIAFSGSHSEGLRGGREKTQQNNSPSTSTSKERQRSKRNRCFVDLVALQRAAQKGIGQ
jgi:hypothetical protein